MYEIRQDRDILFNLGTLVFKGCLDVIVYRLGRKLGVFGTTFMRHTIRELLGMYEFYFSILAGYLLLCLIIIRMGAIRKPPTPFDDE